MNTRLSSSGHIPLNKEKLDALSKAERDFWEKFLPTVMDAIEDAKDANMLPPYAFSPEVFALFKEAVTVHEGDRYCQISQIRALFDCGGI